MYENLIEELWSSDEASVLTNKAARRILVYADRIEELETERDENEAAFQIWRRRCQEADAENASLKGALRDLLAVHNRIMSDPHWRTSDNTLWPDTCDAGEKARAALEGRNATDDQ